jgi:uncharacterized membrane protein
MNVSSVNETIALGAMTGMRSMAGAATLSLGQGTMLKQVVAVMAVGEMIVDKTSLVGDRIDAVPLAGRAVMGAIVGGVAAHERRENVLLGGLLAASAAVIAAHLAYRVRKRLAPSNPLGGFVEDAIVIGIGALYASQTRRRYARI